MALDERVRIRRIYYLSRKRMSDPALSIQLVATDLIPKVVMMYLVSGTLFGLMHRAMRSEDAA